MLKASATPIYSVINDGALLQYTSTNSAWIVAALYHFKCRKLITARCFISSSIIGKLPEELGNVGGSPGELSDVGEAKEGL